MSQALCSSEWVDREVYPFESKYINLTTGKMHYIDEGQGDVLLLVHGTPVWSFIYRNQIKVLSKHFRVIAPDHIGFGLSSRPKNFAYTPKAQSSNLAEFIEKLSLDSFHVVVHDFGGPIGLNYATDHPERIKSLSVLNTWMWSLENDKDLIRISDFLDGWIGRFLYKNLNASAKYLLPKGFSNSELLTKDIHEQYTSAFPDSNGRHATWVFARELKLSGEWFQSIFEKRKNLYAIPMQIIWGMKDELIKQHHLNTWRETMADHPNIRYLEIEDSGHFIQEEAPERLNEALQEFISLND